MKGKSFFIWCIRACLYLVAFLLVWIPLCAIADYVLGLGADPYRMAYGYFAGLISVTFASVVESMVKKPNA